MDKYFYYDSESGFDTFETEQEAIDLANNMIAEAREEAIYDGEWPEWVDSICYGKITGFSVADFQNDNESCDYSLKGQP